MFRKGFTLVEVVVAVAISTVLLAGTVGIAVKAANSLTEEKSKAQTYSALTDAISKLNSVRNAYPLTTVVDVPSGYDFVVFTNSGRTAGVLVGVADAGSGSGDFRLDPASAHQTYGTKVLAVQDITASQTAAALADHSTAFSLPIREESVFRNLVLEGFQATPYNADRLVDVMLGIYVVPRSEYVGRNKTEYPDYPTVINLVL
ncbi:MAG: prepilin-type N-terminal cleavage/methylation domain-containing protein [Patescibacteria group bacterium]